MVRPPRTKPESKSNRNIHQIPLYKIIWCKIRYYQQLYDISDDSLAAQLGVCSRTLSNYDKDARNITIGNIDSFLHSTNITFEELLNL